jgi:hypothetical protein
MFRKVTGFIVMLCAFLLISVSMLPWAQVNAASGFKVYADDSGIWVVSGDPEFCLENLAPGDSASASLEVENKSSQSFTLAISTEFIGDDSSKALFENLCIDIKDCYTGPLGGCQGNILGVFAAGCTERVPLEISLPQGTGNECQGKEVTVRFRITQLGDPENPFEPGEHPELPVTGTDVNFLLPLGLIMFLSGLLLMCSARSRQEK